MICVSTPWRFKQLTCNAQLPHAAIGPRSQTLIMIFSLQQDVTVPIMTSPEYLWWAHTWHMQTPLETLGAGSFVAFELKEKVRSDKADRPTDDATWWCKVLVATIADTYGRHFLHQFAARALLMFFCCCGTGINK